MNVDYSSLEDGWRTGACRGSRRGLCGSLRLAISEQYVSGSRVQLVGNGFSPAERCADEDRRPVFADDRSGGLFDHDRHPYLPFTPGTRTIYENQTPDSLQRTTTEVTRDTEKIMGVDTVVVHDTLTLDGKPAEDTIDWYAQDRDGNVWYFGEATKEFDAPGTNG